MKSQPYSQTYLQPIDSPTNKPLLKFSKLLVSFPVKNVNAKYNKFPKTIKNVPIFLIDSFKSSPIFNYFYIHSLYFFI